MGEEVLSACHSIRFFEYHLAERTMNGTQVLKVSQNAQLFGNTVYVIGYRIVLSFLLIYVIPMSTLVALNGRILAAMCRLRNALGAGRSGEHGP